jgi:hypothetical protein
MLNDGMSEYRNARALEVYTRVQKKLIGRDFNPDEELTVEEQVRKLIAQATALENLCQCFPGMFLFLHVLAYDELTRWMQAGVRSGRHNLFFTLLYRKATP